jgi:hypothetical protein
MKRAAWLFSLPLIVAASVTPVNLRSGNAAHGAAPLRIDSIASPAGAGSAEPSLTTAPNGRVYMSWLERVDSAHALRFASLKGTTWSRPQTIRTSRDFFVNWADFPALSVLDENRIAVHWLQKTGRGTYAYGVRVAQSSDGGKNWSAPLTPHGDSSETEHGFVAMWREAGRLGVVWLDGRNYAKEGHDPTNEMMLLTTTIASDGIVSGETRLDTRTCDCCQNAAAMTSNGPIVAYRDRSANEIRDIYVTRRVNGRWLRGTAVFNDNWRIDACPVNGPAIAAARTRAALAWFTAPEDKPRVNVAFSNDAGATFTRPVRVDAGNPAGRVDVALLRDGSALVTWVERIRGDTAKVLARRVERSGRRSPVRTIAESSAARASGFPRMTVSGEHVVFAWTTSTRPSNVRVARAHVSTFR